MNKEKKVMEYVDAPSGYVTLYNYKEPFMKFEGGFGLQGVLLYDGKEDKVQCHFCGGWFGQLPSHLHREHNMKAADYKERVGLLQTTCLLSESEREKLLRNIEVRKQNLIPGGDKSQKIRKKTSETLRANASKREMQNKQGTCPAQLVDRLQKLAEKLGHIPTIRECTFAETIVKVLGSYNEGIRRAGMTPRSPGQNLNYRANLKGIPEEELLEELRAFQRLTSRYPTYSDHKRALIQHSYNCFYSRFGSYQKALIAAFPELGVQSADENHASTGAHRQPTTHPVVETTSDDLIHRVPKLEGDRSAHRADTTAKDPAPSLIRVPAAIHSQDLSQGQTDGPDELRQGSA